MTTPAYTKRSLKPLKRWELLDLVEKQLEVPFSYAHKRPGECTCKELIGVLVKQSNGYYPAPPTEAASTQTGLSVFGLDGNGTSELTIDREEGPNLSGPMGKDTSMGVDLHVVTCKDEPLVVPGESEGEVSVTEERKDEAAVSDEEEVAFPKEGKVAVPEEDKVAVPEEVEVAIPEERKYEVATPGDGKDEVAVSEGTKYEVAALEEKKNKVDVPEDVVKEGAEDKEGVAVPEDVKKEWVDSLVKTEIEDEMVVPEESQNDGTEGEVDAADPPADLGSDSPSESESDSKEGGEFMDPGPLNTPEQRLAFDKARLSEWVIKNGLEEDLYFFFAQKKKNHEIDQVREWWFALNFKKQVQGRRLQNNYPIPAGSIHKFLGRSGGWMSRAALGLGFYEKLGGGTANIDRELQTRLQNGGTGDFVDFLKERARVLGSI